MVTVISAWISFIVSVLVLGLKTWAFLQTHSTAIFSDAVETIVNVVASVVALMVMRAVAEPADEEHPYGHGKLEYFSSAFEGGMIAFAAIAIGFGAIQSFWAGSQLHQIEDGMMIMAITAVINLLLGLHLRSVAQKNKSEALRASSTHILSDVLTTVAVIASLFLVKWTGFQWLDPLVAVFVAIQLLLAGYKIVRRSMGALIDEREPEALKEISQAITKHRHSGIIDIHHLRIIRSGKFHHIDAHLVVPEFWTVTKAHEFSHEFEAQVVKSYPFDGEFAFHLDPCGKEWCTVCDLADCPIRAKPLKQIKELTPESLIKGPVKE